MKNKIWGIINILLSITLFIILLFKDISVQFVNIITFSLFIGWLFPYVTLLTNGLCILAKINNKIVINFNIISFILNILLIIFVIILYDNKLLTVLIEYILIAIVNLINIIINIIIYQKRHKGLKAKLKKEYLEIKEIKKKNNGIIK